MFKLIRKSKLLNLKSKIKALEQVADLREELAEATAYYYEVCRIADNIQEEIDNLRELLGEQHV